MQSIILIVTIPWQVFGIIGIILGSRHHLPKRTATLGIVILFTIELVLYWIMYIIPLGMSNFVSGFAYLLFDLALDLGALIIGLVIGINLKPTQPNTQKNPTNCEENPQ